MVQPQTDSPRVHSTLAGDPALFELVEMYVEEMPARTARLRRFFDACDWHALRMAARHLTQSACHHGFDHLVPYSANLELKLTHRAPTSEVGEALEALIAQCGRVTSAAGQGQ